jgi:AcrR family transcriptional regulator
MARTRPAGRLAEILDAAHDVFARQGYRRTRMHDVAAAADVSPGLLYTYAAGKDALFSLVVQRAAGVDVEELALPVENPQAGALITVVRRSVGKRMRTPALDAALERTRAPKDVAAELSEIVAEHYDNLHEGRELIMLVERSGAEWPELAEGFTNGRRALVEKLGEYLGRRARTGALRATPDALVAARAIIETSAWFGNHRYGDFDGVTIDESVARATVVDLLTNAFLP